MKLLVTSDLHYNLPQLDWLLRVAERYDAVVLGGDLLNVAGYLDLDIQITVISGYLERMGEITRVMVCSGNHDGESRNSHGEYTAGWLQKIRSESILVDGCHLLHQGILFSVCPWWDGEQSRKAMERMLEEHAALPHTRWVWIHHAPPNNCRISWTGKRYGGDNFLNSLITRHAPEMVISGHIHTAPFYQSGGWIDRIEGTWVCNPGSQPGSIPTTIQLDLSTAKAIFDSSSGRETADLNDPDGLPYDPA